MSLPQEQLFSESGQEQLQEWFSAHELVGKPGMPATVSSVREWARNRRWQSRKKGNGEFRRHRFEYHIDSLPMETRLSLGWSDPTGVVISLCSTPASSDPMDAQVHTVARHISDVLEWKIPKGVSPRTGILLVLEALQNVYDIETIRQVLPDTPEIVWKG